MNNKWVKLAAFAMVGGLLSIGAGYMFELAKRAYRGT